MHPLSILTLPLTLALFFWQYPLSPLSCYVYLFIICFFPLECKLQKLSRQSIWLTVMSLVWWIVYISHSRCSTNICWINEKIKSINYLICLFLSYGLLQNLLEIITFWKQILNVLYLKNHPWQMCCSKIIYVKVWKDTFNLRSYEIGIWKGSGI